MSWQLLILISLIFQSLGIIYQRVSVKAKNNDPIAFSILFQFSVGILIAGWGFFFEDMVLPDLKALIPNLLLMTLLWSLANIFNFKALKVTEASTFTVIFSSRALFTTFASTFVLGEVLNGKQWFGALLIFLGVILVTLKKSQVNLNKNLYLSFLAAVCFGFANTNDRYLLKSFNLFPYVSLAFFLPTLGVILYKPKSLKNIPSFFKGKSLLTSLMVFAFYTVSSITFFNALQIAPNSSQVVTASITGVIVTVLLSIFILKERDDILKKLIGAFLSFIGVYLVS